MSHKPLRSLTPPAGHRLGERLSADARLGVDLGEQFRQRLGIGGFDEVVVEAGLPGAADVAILELREGSFEFLDNYKGTRTGKQRLFPVASVIGGKRGPART